MLGPWSTTERLILGGVLVKRFILLTLIVLAWAFWELSGGTSFEPAVAPDVVVSDASDVAAPVPPAEPQRPAVTPPQPATPDVQPVAAPTPEPARPVEPTPQARPEQAPASEPVAEPVAEPAPAPTPAPQANNGLAALDMRSVDATRVNLRSGPSTDYRVLDTISQGTIVEVLEIDTSPEEPWVRLMVVATGLEGWMAERFLIRQ